MAVPRPGKGSAVGRNFLAPPSVCVSLSVFLHCVLSFSGAVYCNRSCLFVYGFACLFVCLFVGLLP